jgi:hypothetical protein
VSVPTSETSNLEKYTVLFIAVLINIFISIKDLGQLYIVLHVFIYYFHIYCQQGTR